MEIAYHQLQPHVEKEKRTVSPAKSPLCERKSVEHTDLVNAQHDCGGMFVESLYMLIHLIMSDCVGKFLFSQKARKTNVSATADPFPFARQSGMPGNRSSLSAQ